jgi:hypothetical protein
MTMQREKLMDDIYDPEVHADVDKVNAVLERVAEWMKNNFDDLDISMASEMLVYISTRDIPGDRFTWDPSDIVITHRVDDAT